MNGGYTSTRQPRFGHSTDNLYADVIGDKNKSVGEHKQAMSSELVSRYGCQT